MDADRKYGVDIGGGYAFIQGWNEIPGRRLFGGFRRRRPIRVTDENVRGMVRYMRRKLERRAEGRAEHGWLNDTVWDAATDASIPPGVVEMSDGNGDQWRYPLAEFDVADGGRP